MALNINNFFNFQNKNSKIGDFQDLDHLDGLSISTVSADLYKIKRDDLVLFYFREGANYASVYTQSKIISENIKWNMKIVTKKIKAVLINTRNANCFTGKNGFKGIKIIANELADKLSKKQLDDEEKPEKIYPEEILFASTGTIGEEFPTEKIKSKMSEIVNNIKYNLNKYIWMKAAMGILTTDTKPKLAMEECKIGNTDVKIYGVAKGSGMIQPNMATTLGFIFTDANLTTPVLKKLLKKNIITTFNAITCDGDTSTNDMVSIFATGKSKNSEIKNINDPKLKDFNNKLHSVLLNLAKGVVADGEGATKFISVTVSSCKTDNDARKISLSIANSPLVKTAISGEDPNFGRILMAIGKADVSINLNKLNIKMGEISIIDRGEISLKYKEEIAAEYMKNKRIDIFVDIGSGSKSFTSFTMDLSKKYIDINSDYRS